jgi:hypothetical protein
MPATFTDEAQATLRALVFAARNRGPRGYQSTLDPAMVFSGFRHRMTPFSHMRFMVY